MKEFLKKYKKMLICIFLIGFIVPMIIVHCLFKWHSGNDFLTAEWTAGELLEYIGTMISFLGTIVLGALALQASQIANELLICQILIDQGGVQIGRKKMGNVVPVKYGDRVKKAKILEEQNVL